MRWQEAVEEGPEERAAKDAPEHDQGDGARTHGLSFARASRSPRRAWAPLETACAGGSCADCHVSVRSLRRSVVQPHEANIQSNHAARRNTVSRIIAAIGHGSDRRE